MAGKNAAKEEPKGPVADNKQVGAAANTAVGALDARFIQDAGAGFEDADASAYAIPFLQILQSGSPQCKRSDGLYIPGAEEGMFYNSVTQEIYSGSDVVNQNGGEVTKGGLQLVPCHYTQRFIEWQPRETGGGFVTERMPDDPAALQTVKDDKGRDKLPNGNILVDTRNHYVLLVNPDGTIVPIVATFSSTQLKKSRNWMSKMNGIKIKNGSAFITAPMASRMYHASTVPEKNDKGSWFGWKIELVGVVQDATLYQAAMDFRTAIIAGKAKEAQPAQPAAEPAIDA